MSLTADDISFVYSGGHNNRDPNRSLGGHPSVQPIIGKTLNNLFDDVSSHDKDEGREEWRCFYVFNDSESGVLYNTRIFISGEVEGGASVQLGFLITHDKQAIDLSAVPSGGQVVFSYENNGFAVVWNGTIEGFAQNLCAALADFVGEGIAHPTDIKDTGFVVEFSDAKLHPALVVGENSLGVAVTVSKAQDGSPVNAITVEVDNETTPPNGISCSYPTEDEPVYLGNLFPGDGFPVWVKRTVDPDVADIRLDGFTVKLLGEPFAVPDVDTPPDPPPDPETDSYTYTGSGGILIGGSAATSTSGTEAPVVTLPCDFCCRNGTTPEYYVLSINSIKTPTGVTDCDCNRLIGTFGLKFNEDYCWWEGEDSGRRTNFILFYDPSTERWVLTGCSSGCMSLRVEWMASDWNCCGKNRPDTSVDGIVLSGCETQETTSLEINPGCLVNFGPTPVFVAWDPSQPFSYCQPPPCQRDVQACPEVYGGGVRVGGCATYKYLSCVECSTTPTQIWPTIVWQGFGGLPGDQDGLRANRGDVFPIFVGRVGGMLACRCRIKAITTQCGSTAIRGTHYQDSESVLTFDCNQTQVNVGLVIYSNCPSGSKIVYCFTDPDGCKIDAEHPTFTVTVN